MKHPLRPLFVLFLPLLLLASCGTDVEFNEGGSSSTVRNNANANDTRLHPVSGRLEFPRLDTHRSYQAGADYLIVHEASFGVNYCVQWDTEKRAQRWSCYSMHAGNSSSKTDRKPNEKDGKDFSEYPNDPDLPSEFHFTRDPYTGSGYDHGHIIPSADRAYSYNEKANRQTFYMTNMQPQLNSFNAGLWLDMENHIHGSSKIAAWNNSNFRDTLYIVKGGTIDDEANIIRYLGSGENKIPVPKYFFMAILCKSKTAGNGGYKAIGFWIAQNEANNEKDATLRKYVRNIDELEELTGLDFFCNLPDDIEKAVESLPRENVIKAWNLDK